MVVVLVVATFLVAIVINAVLVRWLAQKKAEQLVSQGVADEQLGEPANADRDLMFHEGHTWVKLIKAVVSVGMDDFTQRLVGRIDRIEVPKPGTRVKKGQKLWTVHFGDKMFTQVAPVSGTVVEVNERLISDPTVINRSPYAAGWVLKIVPDSLNEELPELFSPSKFEKWTYSQKARFFPDFLPDLQPAYGDGGELVNGAARQMDEARWRELSEKLFGT